MWGVIFGRIIGHSVARSIFKESLEDKAKRIAEEKRKQREELIASLVFLVVLVLVCAGLWYYFSNLK